MDYRTQARETATRYGIPTDLFSSLIEGESSFDPWAVGQAGEIGLGQLMPATAIELGVDPWNPQQNLDGAARYLRQHYERFGNWRDALAAYKGGAGHVANPGPQAAAAKVLEAAGLDDPLGVVETAAQGAAGKTAAAQAEWSWTDPWPWVKARGLDIATGALGALLIFAGVLMLTKTGGAFVDGVRAGAVDALRGR